MPDNYTPPSIDLKVIYHSAISIFILLNLFSPIFHSRFRQTPERTILVTVPETTVNENCDLSFWDYYIRFAGKILRMETIPNSIRPKIPAHEELDSRVFAMDRGHHPTALFFGSGVGHRFSII
jgi:hypothetical protein